MSKWALNAFFAPELLALMFGLFHNSRAVCYRATAMTFVHSLIRQRAMKMNLLVPSCLLFSFAQHVYAQDAKPGVGSNPILEERLRNAQVKEIKLSNGAVIREVKFAGSLQPNFNLGCISMSEVTSKFNPPALIYAAKKCIKEHEYSKAWALLTTGYGFAYYDVKRLADRSTQGARSVLSMNAFADLTNDERELSSKASDEIMKEPEQVQAYCTELTRIGPPTYEPQWAILHGIGAYQEPRDGHYLTNVDTKALWEEVLRNRCTAKKS